MPVPQHRHSFCRDTAEGKLPVCSRAVQAQKKSRACTSAKPGILVGEEEGPAWQDLSIIFIFCKIKGGGSLTFSIIAGKKKNIQGNSIF